MDIKRFARHGGPDLTSLRCCPPTTVFVYHPAGSDKSNFQYTELHAGATYFTFDHILVVPKTADSMKHGMPTAKVISKASLKAAFKANKALRRKRRAPDAAAAPVKHKIPHQRRQS
ncbi:hypothetical protein BO70DRAFT_399022 [Aspergillus heteromorphus CBS 117.55]|uniref:Uncharacterized protein n=1 Tax=Aspergillus heteromorphus CBS 117.55 TaxID=1448321 RepID=A0A317VF01_9EURO|nr:uncharacterized protein BO70DRAFT_399022 [Aspergillus heteromorphus CBS 117.55]PWY72946.1 hypothetical protein BO70DRAFT_399022 [Aspergillus heteromorphus CBS 117.55]